MPPLFSKTVEVLSEMLTYRSKRHQVILSNITNIDTPGYKPADLKFNKTLQNAIVVNDNLQMIKTNDQHILKGKDGNDSGTYEISSSEEGVKVDQEMANMAENQLMYNLTIELLARKFRGLQNVLKDAK